MIIPKYRQCHTRTVDMKENTKQNTSIPSSFIGPFDRLALQPHRDRITLFKISPQLEARALLVRVIPSGCQPAPSMPVSQLW